jgi:hypothetical protein
VIDGAAIPHAWSLSLRVDAGPGTHSAMPTAGLADHEPVALVTKRLATVGERLRTLRLAVLLRISGYSRSVATPQAAIHCGQRGISTGRMAWMLGEGLPSDG